VAQRLIYVQIYYLPFMKKPVLLLATAVFSLFILSSFLPADKHPVRSAKKIHASKKATKHLVKAKDDNPYYIIIDKSDYELKVYDEDGWYATYPIVFGSKDLGDKMKEGDRKTPDGKFKIILKKLHPKWGPELLLDYPTGESVQRFNERRKKGVLPKNAKIGGGIAIHATRPEEEWTVDNFYNWTDGCISVKYTEMKDLFSYIPIETVVTIQQ
jgi:murein L,D-transpeptidase YafK